MPVLHLGVDDIPYTDGGETTGDVAEILEEKYHVIEVFYMEHEKEIAIELEKSVSGALESLLMGAPTSGSPFDSANGAIEKEFHKFLDQQEMDKLGYPGVPTKAALAGKSKRLKSKKGPPRPSFIDLGMYEASFRSWVD